MKIRTDSVPLQSPSYKSARKSSGMDVHSSVRSSVNISRNLNLKLNLERALTEALNIAQLTRNLLDKAHSAVSTLRTSDVPDQKISEFITEYKTAAPEIAAKSHIFTENNIREIPAMADDAGRIAALKSKTAQPAEIDFIDSSLQMKIESVQISIDQIERRISGLYPSSSKRNSSYYTDLLSHTARMIVKNANSALAMQGNISRESISRLNIS